MAKSRKSKKFLLAEAIKACADADGKVRPEAVIKAARNPKSILHNEFEWNLEKAAKQTWMETAKRLIREVRLDIVYEEKRIQAPYYVRDTTSKVSQYQETTMVARRKSEATQTLRDEITRVIAALERASTLAKVFNLRDRFKAMLTEAMEVQRIIIEFEE